MSLILKERGYVNKMYCNNLILHLNVNMNWTSPLSWNQCLFCCHKMLFFSMGSVIHFQRLFMYTHTVGANFSLVELIPLTSKSKMWPSFVEPVGKTSETCMTHDYYHAWSWPVNDGPKPLRHSRLLLTLTNSEHKNIFKNWWGHWFPSGTVQLICILMGWLNAWQ